MGRRRVSRQFSPFRTHRSLHADIIPRSGLVGSLYYGSQLSEKEADAIRIYYNYDMIGSLEPEWAVYADTDVHEFVGAPIFDYLTENGKEAFYG